MSRKVPHLKVAAAIARSDDIKWVASKIKSGYSCCLMGISDVGVSYIARALCSPSVLHTYFHGRTKPTVMVYVDLHLLEEKGPSSLLNLINNSILGTRFEPTRRNLHTSSIGTISRGTDPPSMTTEIDRLKKIVNSICKGNRILCLVLDAFSEPIQQVDKATLLSLRAIRDQFKPSLSYVICLYQQPEYLRSDEEVKPFTSLFYGNSHYVRPMDKAETERMIISLEERRSVSLNDSLRQKLGELSGGHPGLVQILFEIMVERWPEDRVLVMDKVMLEDGVMKECDAIMNSLSSLEINLLKQFPSPQVIEPSVMKTLLDKGVLVTSHSESPKVFSPILAEYLRALRSETGNIEIDLAGGLVFCDQEDITGTLSPSEQSLLMFLAKNKDKACSKDEVAVALWPAEELHGLESERIQKVVDRLRAKLNDKSKNGHEYIRTIWGRGYQFVSKEVKDA